MEHNCHEGLGSSCICNHSSNDSHDSCLNIVPIFNHLKDVQKDEVLDLINSVKYKKGEMIYRAGEKSDSLFIISSGRIKKYRLSESGKEQLIQILRAGDFTGELALFSEGIYESYAEAMEDTWVCTVKSSDLQELLLKYPSISLKILNEFSSRLEQSEKQTTSISTERVETRIAQFLVEYAEDNNTLDFKLPMSRKDLASYLGTSPESISRKLLELEEADLIIQKPQSIIKIIDLEGLKAV
ncbi:MAG: Crp/Fnr family transcriptional regulator [Clostridiales bacterium]|nr:Crp/Fnr family transcriptional regulator [Clostridiales bacterium]